MPLTPFDAAGNQIKSALQNQARAATAGVIKQTSIVGQVNANVGSLVRGVQKKGRGYQKETQSGVYIAKAEALAKDGYIRKSQVQAIRVPSDYKKKRMRKMIGGIVGALLVGLIAGLIIGYLL